MGLQMLQIFPQILCLQASVLIVLWHCFQILYARAQLKVVFKRTLDYYPNKFLKYANAAEKVKTMSVAPFFSSLGMQK